MSWFRLQRRSWAWTALFALALQLCLSFGHVHGLAGGHINSVQLSAVQGGGPAPIPSNNSGDHDDDYCAICAVLAMLSGAQTASAPAVALPTFVTSAERLTVPDTLVSEPQRAAFRSRAPPQA
jgi:Protein of unknown function (DUF2946)